MTYGSLFTGYGGLDMAVAEVFGDKPAWVSDIDNGACKIIDHRMPDVPNLGDITDVDWDTVPRVRGMGGGFPCQDLSHAGKRAGMHEGTRSGLWSHMATAIDQLRPQYVVAENVRGLLSATATSDVEPCPWCMGDTSPDSVLRALGCVLGDLADIGYDAQWCGLRAADVGAPHGRFRIFILATGTRGVPGDAGWQPASGQTEGGRACGEFAGRDRASVADTDDDRWRQQQSRRSGKELAGSASPARIVADSGGQRHGRGEDTGTLGCVDSENAGQTRQRERPRQIPIHRGSETWGDYAPAIRRWEHTLGRLAPAPTETSTRGTQRLSPAFVEWMQGLPAGWVTDVPDLTRNEQLKALGNGVVKQQAVAAFHHMINNQNRVAA